MTISPTCRAVLAGLATAAALAGQTPPATARPAGAALEPAEAAPPTADDYAHKRDAKLAEPFVARAPWTTDLDAARRDAAARGALIFAYFTRSYAPCGPCHQLENTLFSDRGESNRAFTAWAEDHVLLLHVTSWVYSDPHHDLCSERGGFGFPYLAFLDADGQALAGSHGVTDLDGLRQLEAAARATLATARAAAAGDRDARVRLVLQRLEMEALSLAEARDQVAAIAADLEPAQRARVDQLVINREIADLLAQLRRELPAAELPRAVPHRAVELFRAGKVPTNRLASHFFPALLQYARATRDDELAAQVLARLDALVADWPDLAALAKSLHGAGR